MIGYSFTLKALKTWYVNNLNINVTIKVVSPFQKSQCNKELTNPLLQL